MADRPPFKEGETGGRSDVNSLNHDGTGQNVLFVDGSVTFCKTTAIGIDRDAIYVNRKNEIAAGTDSKDTVLGASWASPSSNNDE